MALLDFLGSAAGSAAMSGGGSLVDAVASIWNNERNRSLQQEQNALARQFTRDERIAAQDYNTSERIAVQDYNTPSHQLERLSAAGVNPNNAVGIVSGNSGASPASISHSSAPMVYADQPNPIDFSQLAVNMANAKNAFEDARGKEIDNDTRAQRNTLSVSQQREAIKNIQADTAYKESLKNLNDTQRDQMSKLTDLLVQQKKTEVEALKKTLSKYDAEISLLRLQQENAKKQGQEIDAHTSLLNAQTSTAKAQGFFISEQTKEAIWANSCRMQGFDPKSTLGQNVLRILLAEPDKAPQMIGNAVDTVVRVWDKIKPSSDDDGPHWSGSEYHYNESPAFLKLLMDNGLLPRRPQK